MNSRLALWLAMTNGVCVCGHSCSVVLNCSVVSTLCTSMDCSLSGSSVHGILQASILEWVDISSSRGSSNPGIQPRDWTHVSCSSCTVGGFFTFLSSLFYSFRWSSSVGWNIAASASCPHSWLYMPHKNHQYTHYSKNIHCQVNLWFTYLHNNIWIF